MECLAIGHEVTMHPELPNCGLSSVISTKVEGWASPAIR